MFFDDEKDNLDFFDDSQDDSISLDKYLDTDEDGIVSIKGGTTAENSDLPIEVFSNNTDGSDMNELNSVIDDGSQSDSLNYSADEVDEEEIRRILTSAPDDSSDSLNTGDESQEADDLSINQEEEHEEHDDIIENKEENSQKKVVSTALIVLLLALIALAVIYFFFLNSSDDKTAGQNNQQPLPAPPAQEETMPQNEAAPQNEEVAQPAENAIPVVNEEDTSSLKPEDKEENKEEKKEVVAIVPTGRINPFMPIKKYSTPPAPVKMQTEYITKTINNIDYNSVSIPKPPKAYGNVNEYTEKLMTISVSGIMYDKVKPSAIITYEDNDYFVQTGDKLNNFRVVEIGPTYVKIALGKNTYKANVGENFTINDFYGNVPYKNGSRQYYSSEKEFENRGNVSSLQIGDKKYVNELDVKIKAN